MSDFLKEFRNSEAARKMGGILSSYSGSPVTLMEVCGTHTMSIFRYGIRELLPDTIRLISGPGCPVCVTPGYYMNAVLKLAEREDVILTTFGDMMRIPGNGSTLLQKKAEGRDVRIVYSPLDSLKIASANPDKKVVFLSVGFETTTPVVALTVKKAMEDKLANYYVLTANKTVPEALKLLSGDSEIGVDGYLYPGHVSAITGTAIYEELAEKYHIPGVVAGFEPLDILGAIITLVKNINKGIYTVENQYSRVVKKEGNPVALSILNEVFEPIDAEWRGIGTIPGSGLGLREEYSAFDAWKHFDLRDISSTEPPGCSCGEILKGIKTPSDCKLFGTGCTPENPIGSCMVSSEGTCAAYYKYGL